MSHAIADGAHRNTLSDYLFRLRAGAELIVGERPLGEAARPRLTAGLRCRRLRGRGDACLYRLSGRKGSRSEVLNNRSNKQSGHFGTTTRAAPETADACHGAQPSQ